MDDLMVFDLQRFALHDGPGIRTTVFLKGCPLDCVWCHNPESKKGESQLGYLEKNCTKCGRCQSVCTEGVHQICAEGKHEIDYKKCVQCGKCVEKCFQHALKIYGQKRSIDEILEIVMKDKDFYGRSGGGITISGGEPMLQFEGLLSLLKKAKGLGLHVCLDTSGQAAREKYLEVAKYVDVFLYDYKLTEADAHKRYTGVDNRRILENLKVLCENGNEIHLRCPIIPGINDNEEHYKGIARLSHMYKNGITRVNLMMYHDMAKGKVRQIGEAYVLSGLKSIDADGKKKIYQAVEECGCIHLQES